MIYHIFGHCSNDLDLLVRCLEKHILPNGGFSRWFTMEPSVKKKPSQRCLKQIQAMMFLFLKYLDVPSIRVSKWLVSGL